MPSKKFWWWNTDPQGGAMPTPRNLADKLDFFIQTFSRTFYFALESSFTDYYRGFCGLKS